LNFIVCTKVQYYGIRKQTGLLILVSFWATYLFS
jgi:hypothetical protein